MIKFKYFGFGVTSAVLTSIAIIISLSNTVDAKMSIIIALLIVAIADNVSDSFGIHIHEECKCEKRSNVIRTTIENFSSRLLISLIFVIIVIMAPIKIAIFLSIILAIFIIIILSYYISKNQKINPYKTIIHHLLITVVIIIAGFLLRYLISNFSLIFPK